jgi:hypothetical protein
LDWPVIIAFLIIGLYFYGVQFSRGRSPGFCFFGTSRTPDKFLRPANDMVRRFPPSAGLVGGSPVHLPGLLLLARCGGFAAEKL